MKKIKFIYCVITNVGEKSLYGDWILKVGKEWIMSREWSDKKKPIVGKDLIHIKTPPFQIGELLVLDADIEREIGYPQRKPSKWGTEEKFMKKYSVDMAKEEVTYRYFNDLHKAAHFSKLVQKRKLGL